MIHKAGFTHEKNNSENVEWYTPKYVFDNMDISFDLDPCQPEGGISWIPCDKFYTPTQDGLSQPWVGSVWLNPPYGKYTIEWLKKMDEHRYGMALLFSRTDCRWFHDYAIKADAMLFTRGRINFVDINGKERSGGSGCGSVFLAYGAKHVNALYMMNSYWPQKYGFLVDLKNVEDQLPF